MSIRDTMKKKGADAPPLLHGEDLPKGKSSVTIIVKEIREAPDNFNSIAIIDLAKPAFGKASWAVNKTNMMALLEKFGLSADDAEISDLNRVLSGKKLNLTRVMVNNPQAKRPVPSLFIA